MEVIENRELKITYCDNCNKELRVQGQMGNCTLVTRKNLPDAHFCGDNCNNEYFNQMKKLIDIPEEIVKPLKIKAIEADKDLKNYIQDLLIKHVHSGGKK